MKKLLFLLCLSCMGLYQAKGQKQSEPASHLELLVLGTVQDAGSPHIACKKVCCQALSAEEKAQRKVVSLGIIDHKAGKKYLLDASPDLPAQLALLDAALPTANFSPDGIFLSHAHIGHYTGLMYLGREAMNSNKVAVYSMPKMIDFLSNNGPWDQLVALENIRLLPLQNAKSIQITPDLSITPLQVPHRDEYSETVGFLITGPEKKALYIPDIDKWGKWSTDIVEMVKQVDFAFLDATFYDQRELPHRDISEIPHPFVVESMAIFNGLDKTDKAKIRFIHLNHSNPLLRKDSKAYERVVQEGFGVAQFMDRQQL